MPDNSDDDLKTNMHIKREADRVREGEANPHFIVHERWVDGAVRVENQATRERRRRPKLSVTREEGRDFER